MKKTTLCILTDDGLCQVCLKISDIVAIYETMDTESGFFISMSNGKEFFTDRIGFCEITDRIGWTEDGSVD
jgi:hypothetical protein